MIAVFQRAKEERLLLEILKNRRHSWKGHTVRHNECCVHWTVRHLDGRIKRDQPDVTCFFISLFNAQHVSDVNTSILRSLRLIC